MSSPIDVLVRDIMVAPVATVEFNSDLLSAIHKMNKLRIGSLVIVKSGYPVGIITERDILLKIAGNDINIKAMKVQDIMTSPVHIVKGEASVEEAAKIMAEKSIRRLPVVKERTLIGIVTSSDIAKAVAKGILTREVCLYLSDIFKCM